MMQRLSLVFSATALAVAVLGLTPLGQAAGEVIAKGVPYAEVSGFANNAAKLNGHASSAKPKAAQIPVLNSSGKLPASIGAVGPAGPKGDPGAKGDQGGPGLSAYQQVAEQITVPAGGKTTDYNVSCPGGKAVLSGGYNLSGGNNDAVILISQPNSNTAWGFRIRNPTGNTRNMTVYLVCANVAS